jgi:hypothetical protein
MLMFFASASEDNGAGVFGAIFKFFASVIFIFLAIIALVWG